MTDQSLRGFIKDLERNGELLSFSKEIDPDNNMSAVSWRAFSELGQSSRFENIKGHPRWRVAAQILANRRKWAVALGVSENEVVPTLNARIKSPIAPDDTYQGPAPVKDVIRLGSEVNLDDLPAMWTSEKDPGRYVAAGMCILKDPHTKRRNMSFHRAQLLQPDRTGFLICPRQALKIFEMYSELGRPMEVAMVIGAHPALVFAGGYVAPYETDELAIAGGLLGEPVRLVKCETIDVEVPAEAEIVLEGEIVPGERTPEGPFGEVTGTYAQEGTTPLFRVKAITHRNDPIFYAMQCGLPPSDTQSIVCLTIEMRLWEHIQKVAGGIELLDVRCLGTMTPLMVVIKLRKQYAGEANHALLAALSSPYLHPKFAIAVDEDIDASDVNSVMWAVATRAAPQKDIQKIHSARTFALDNASDIEPGMSAMYRMGTKMLIDATRPFQSGQSQSKAFERKHSFDLGKIDLETYLSAEELGKQVDSVSIRRPVDHLMELPAVSDKIQNDLGKASEFADLKDYSDWTVARNIMADRERLLTTLGVSEPGAVGALSHRLNSQDHSDPVIGEFTEIPKSYNESEATFSALPLQVASSETDLRSIGAAIALTLDPDTGAPCAALTRHQIIDQNSATVSDMSRHFRRVWSKYQAQSADMPLLIILGAHPVSYLSAAISNDLPFDFLATLNSLSNDHVAFRKNEQGIPVPSDAGILLEGKIVAGSAHLEAASLDITGLHREGENVPVFRFERLWRQPDAAYVSMSSGDGSSDVAHLHALATEIVVWRHIEDIEGGIDLLDVRCHPATGNNVIVVKFRPKVGGQSKTVLMAALSSPSIRPKIAIGVDEDVDAGDLRDVIWSVASRTHAEYDVTILKNFLASSSDPTARRISSQDGFASLGAKILIDSTMAPLSQSEKRQSFERAIPKHLAQINLADFLD